MNFDLTDLKLFINIAESSSLTQGARKTFMSAAAASIRIKELEVQLNTSLLYRHRKGVELTESGHTLLQHARLISRQVAHLKVAFTEFENDASGHIRIFANTTAVTECLPEILAGFLAQRPGVTVDLQERLTRDIIRGVLEGSTDLGIVAGPVVSKELQVLHFNTDRLVLVVPANHPLTLNKTIKLLDTLAFPHIGQHEGSTLQAFIREQAERLDVALSWRIQLSSFEAICRMVEAGVGIGVIPESAAIRHSKTMRLVILQLDEPWVVRERSILVRNLETLPGCVRPLIALLRGQ